jgi:hypothetical protein
MEPIAASAAFGVVRPAAVQSGEAAAILRAGRILIGDVLSAADGTVLLAIGRQKIPAETAVALDPGQELLLRVEQGPQGILLQILGDESSEGSDLLRALRAVVGEDEPLGALFSELAAGIKRAEGGNATLLDRLASALAQNAFAPSEAGEAGAGLLALLENAPLRFESLLAAALAAPHAGAFLERLRASLKAELSAALERLEEGPLRTSVERLQAALDSEQLLNVARERAGEPLSWGLPVRDGEGFATARFSYRRRRQRAGDEHEAQAGEILVLGIRLSRLGPVRAELALEKDRLLARIDVARPDLVERLQADYDGLAQRLRRGERQVQLFVRVLPEAEIEVEPERLDIRFLREHRLMDVSG